MTLSGTMANIYIHYFKWMEVDLFVDTTGHEKVHYPHLLEFRGGCRLTYFFVQLASTLYQEIIILTLNRVPQDMRRFPIHSQSLISYKRSLAIFVTVVV